MRGPIEQPRDAALGAVGGAIGGVAVGMEAASRGLSRGADETKEAILEELPKAPEWVPFLEAAFEVML